MNRLKNFWASVSKWFDKLPNPVKAIFFILLNSWTLLLVADLQAIQNNYNQYVQAAIIAVVNLLSYLSLHFGSKIEQNK
jgi:p-aminobenzoyl-glutamate transporter AbgT